MRLQDGVYRVVRERPIRIVDLSVHNIDVHDELRSHSRGSLLSELYKMP